MLKRDRRMNVNKGMLLFNGAGVLVGLAIAGSFVSSYFHTEEIPACTDRYTPAFQLALDTATGAAMSPIELQSRAGTGEWGVLENASVVHVPGAPSASVMEVKLAPAPNTAPQGSNVAGIGMIWVPHALASAGSACLSYSVYLPEGFEFANGGTLPGLYGGLRPQIAHAAGAADSPGYFTRLQWDRDGGVHLSMRFSGKNAPPSGELVMEKFTMPRGRWVAIRQEIGLNTPGTANGVLRVWVDGKLRLQYDDLTWRNDAATTIAGVLLDVTSPPAGGKPMALRLSAPVLGWKQG